MKISTEEMIELSNETPEGRRAVEAFILKQKESGRKVIEMAMEKDGRRIPIYLQQDFRISWEARKYLVITYKDGRTYSTR